MPKAHRRIEIKCLQCGQPKKARLSDVNNPKKPNAGKFCGKRCAALYAKQMVRNERNARLLPLSASIAPIPTDSTSLD
jgi:hypothetical protein